MKPFFSKEALKTTESRNGVSSELNNIWIQILYGGLFMTKNQKIMKVHPIQNFQKNPLKLHNITLKNHSIVSIIYDILCFFW